jgi:hypothetical protein
MLKTDLKKDSLVTLPSFGDIKSLISLTLPNGNRNSRIELG